ncbi:hypothetical protein COEREDRAFT_9003 [Coemansia reversa NRRL 1564]|uniref:Uncharacterized protein n=1 Tax=Coemansia reversa (strain ATCC 12441 / NRRL 1564) TaxID=763665 RepID=A0A2G5B9V7_COERN|nr:hypothetical protein COEREDRAFT_9003 [Coemansia reversa NRRL 1564]|eukprot:PIA15762.1 hypothetical protein COEREDRAFT_9003 [Coemansia reversa NRRL 1564]
MTQSYITAGPAGDMPAYFRHKRDSSLSTNCSIISGQSRVLPFATTSTLRPVSSQSTNSSITRKFGCKTMAAISEVSSDRELSATTTIKTEANSFKNTKNMYFVDNPRFAMARPRRVVTQLAPEKNITGIRDRSRSSTAISIGSILGESNRSTQLKGMRARPIIGLGLTLNPADTLVRLQPRRSATQPEADTIAMLPHSLTSNLLDAFDSIDAAPSLTKDDVSATARSSVVLSEAFSYKSPMLESCVSLVDLASPRNTDPQLIVSKPARAPIASNKENTMAAVAQASIDSWISSPESSADYMSVTSIHDETDSKVPTDKKSPECLKVSNPKHVQKQSFTEPQVVSCFLCFESVKLAPTPNASTNCSGCGTILNFSHVKSYSSHQFPHWY